MGLRALDGDPVFLADDRAGVELALKAHLFDTRPDEVLAVSPDAAEECAELAGIVAAATGQEPDRRHHPLEGAARLVQEDLTIVRPGPGGHVLVAGAVCFPSGWYLSEKLGRPLLSVHGPIEGYSTELSTRVERFFAGLRSDRPYCRRNWFLYDDPTLHQPWDPANDVPIPAEGAERRIFIRSEREVMLRMPATGSIVFTIRTQQTRLDGLAERPDVAAAMADYLRRSPTAVHRLKGVAPYLPQVLAALDRMADDDPAGRPISKTR